MSQGRSFLFYPVMFAFLVSLNGCGGDAPSANPPERNEQQAVPETPGNLSPGPTETQPPTEPTPESASAPPVALDIATRLGVNPDPFLMAVAVAASCAFLTPIGHKNNIIIMGPGGYRFGDYWRLGLMLEVIVVLVSIPVILWVWPL